MLRMPASVSRGEPFVPFSNEAVQTLSSTLTPRASSPTPPPLHPPAQSFPPSIVSAPAPAPSSLASTFASTRAPRVMVVVAEAGPRSRLFDALSPSIPGLLVGESPFAALDPDEPVDAVVLIRPRFDDDVMRGLRRLREEDRPPRVFVLTTDERFDDFLHSGVVDRCEVLPRTVIQVATAVAEGLLTLGIRV
jgi:hypothetical protein